MQEEIKSLIWEFVQKYPDLKKTKARWKEPLVAYASAEDPLFLKLKEVVSPSHALPEDLLEDARSVITYFLPFDEAINESNISGRDVSRLWAETYIETNQLILDLNHHLSAALAEGGYASAIIPATHNFDEKKLISDWSHRHAAYIAGLGNFGVNNMLITEKGCCGRVGSLLTNLPLQPTARGEKEYCLARHDGSCNLCVEQCVNDALFPDSYDRWKCYEMCLHNDRLFPDMGTADVCGKCLVGVPCSTRDPVKKVSQD